MVTKLTFDRGHGSAWGNQFYIELSPEEIVILRYIPEGSAELETREHIPIREDTWKQLQTHLEALTLEEETVSLWQRLFGSKKLDGGAYRRLILSYEDRAVTYRWPEGGDALEAFLETLAKEAVT